MRKLTQTEIDAAPGWAKSYSIQAQNDTPIFYAGEGGGAQPIPCKEFDIREHEFYSLQWVKPLDDGDIDFTVVDGCGGQSGGLLTKQDAIALAKHFKLTASDLS